MSRVLNSPVADQRSEFAYLYVLEYSGGSLYLTNASFDITYDGHTFASIGGRLVHDATPETTDSKAQGLTLQLFGVDQAIISAILSNNFRGRDCLIYLVHFHPDTGVMSTPDLIWRGRQDGDYTIKENIDQEDSTIEVDTRIVSSVAVARMVRSLRANVASHQEMLRRAGLATTDQFFKRVPALMNREVYWGTESPTKNGRSSGSDGSTGESGGDNTSRIIP